MTADAMPLATSGIQALFAPKNDACSLCFPFVVSYGEAMSDENGNIESHTLVLLREIRDRLDRVEKTQDQHGAMLAQHGQVLDVLLKAVTALDSTQQKQTEILKELAEQGRNHGARLNAMDGRLGLIEKRVGLANA